MGVKDSQQNALLGGVRIASASNPRGLAVQAVSPDGRQQLAQQALRWTYAVRSRQRWVRDAELRDQLEASARSSLAQLGVDDAQLQALAREPVLVVRMPYQQEALGWEGRILPWEYLLAAATRQHRRGPTGRPKPLTVIRELQVQVERAKGLAVKPTQRVELAPRPRVLFVGALPAELREQWGVDGELAQLRRVLPDDVVELRVLDHPSLDELVQELREFRPTLLHFAGMDSHQGLRELARIKGGECRVGLFEEESGKERLWRIDELRADKQRMVDGLLLRGANGLPRLVPALELARTLAQANVPVYLTTFNVWNSAARLAPLMVAEGGTLAAVGFQDAFDDSLAEFMLVQLLTGLFASHFDLPWAFERAWLIVRELPESVDATGVTLWVGAPAVVAAASRGDQVVRAPLGPRAGGEAADIVQCHIEPFGELNYSALHNAQPLFKRFLLSCEDPAGTVPVDVEVALHMGVEQACFQRRVVMRHERENLTDKIHVPLTADIVRSARETVNSTLRVSVKQGEKVLYHDSHRLRLMPVDQWRDNRHDGRWLPSFVLPRDPLVGRAMLQAQRYNRVLRDDPAAGFEGYQCVPDHDLSEEALRGVDQQVQAIWATLLHDWQLGYINPPPTYSDGQDSQRLRTPSNVHADRAGTCIDLALLFAACLELIDIYPVIFLLNGHALPGWWRHPSYRDEYLGLREMSYAGLVSGEASGEASDPAQGASWQAGASSWPDVMTWIREGKLVPIETVRLTEHCGFIEAIEAGIEALSQRGDYDSMLDILTARHALVTPLPMLGEPA